MITGAASTEARAASKHSDAGPRRHRRLRFPVRALAFALLLTACSDSNDRATVRARIGVDIPVPRASASEPNARRDLAAVGSWGIQLTGFDRAGALDDLRRADVDLVVIDPIANVRGRSDYPIRALVRRLRSGDGRCGRPRLCLAYVNVAEAERYRDYWGGDWRPPTDDDAGYPAFLIGADREGWADNYPVRYWTESWHRILYGSESAVVDRILACGFDGLFLDWVAGWQDEVVGHRAREEGVDPAGEMARLLANIASHGRTRSPGLLLLANNGAPLVEEVPALAEVLDGVVQESVSYSGRAADDWQDPENADARQPPLSVEWAERALDRCRALGLTVLVLDYASRPENILAARTFARLHGYLPCVSRTPLDRLPEHIVRR